MTLRGTVDTTLDVKNRITIPAKQRRHLEDGVVVAKQPDAERCVSIWRTDDFDAHVQAVLADKELLSPDRVALERYFYAHSTELELDAAGRVMLPAKLLEEAGLDREVTLIGVGNRFEVWDREAWRRSSGEIFNTVKGIGPGRSNGHTA